MGVPVFTGIIWFSSRIYQPKAAVKVTILLFLPQGVDFTRKGVQELAGTSPIGCLPGGQCCGPQAPLEHPSLLRPDRSSEPLIHNQPPTFSLTSVPAWRPAANLPGGPPRSAAEQIYTLLIPNPALRL